MDNERQIDRQDEVGIDGERIRLAENFLGEASNSLIKSFVRMRHLKELGAPTAFITRELELMQSRGRNIDFLSGICGKNPQEVVLNEVDRILRNFDEGLFLSGRYLGDFTREDRGILEELKVKIASAVLTFERGGDSEREAFDKQIQRVKELPNILPNFYFLDGSKVKFGGWNKVRPGEVGSEELDSQEVGLWVPLIPRRQISVEFKGLKGGEIVSELDNLGTYQVVNGPFFFEGDNGKVRRISCFSGKREFYLSTRSYEYNETRVSKEMLSSFQRLKNIDSSLIREIFLAGLGLGKENLSGRHLGQILLDSTRFIRDKQTGESVSVFEEGDLNFLLERYKRSGTFPGTCKAAATLLAGFSESISLPSRILQGQIVNIKDGTGGGHEWPEVYIPAIARWVPVDPAGWAFMVYPEDNIYILEGKIDLSSDSKLKIRLQKKALPD